MKKQTIVKLMENQFKSIYQSYGELEYVCFRLDIQDYLKQLIPLLEFELHFRNDLKPLLHAIFLRAFHIIAPSQSWSWCNLEANMRLKQIKL